MRELVPRGGTFVDVGANIGILTLVAAEAVGPSGRVVAVEPGPATFRALEANVELHALSNVHVVEAAAGPEPGVVAVTDLITDDQNRVVEWGAGPHVPLTTVDILTKDIEVVDLLKLDVEGYEVAVLRGAPELLLRCRAVLVEVGPQNLARYGETPTAGTSLLERAGFELLDPSSRAPAGPFAADDPPCNVLGVRRGPPNTP